MKIIVKITKNYNKEKLLYFLVDRPTKINSYDNNGNNCFIWLNNKNQIHRDYNLPAVILDNEFFGI